MKDYIPVKISLEGRTKEKFFQQKELDRLYDTDPVFFIFKYMEGFGNGRAVFSENLSEIELKNYYQALFQDTFHVVLRRYMKIPEKLFLNVCHYELEVLRITYKVITGKDLEYSSLPAQIMLTLYQEMKKIVLISGKEETVVTISENAGSVEKIKEEKIGGDQSEHWQERVINFLGRQVKENFNQFVEHAFLQGSFATRDFIPGWSDLDVVIFLKDEVFTSIVNLTNFKKNMRKLSLLVYKIDPLAHHEFMFFTAFDREHYPAFLFPPTLFTYAKDLFGHKTITLLPRPEFHERIAPVAKLAHFFRQKILKDLISQDNFSWKNDISLIMLFPSLLLVATNVEVYKKFSFKKVKGSFPDLDFSVIDEVSLIRETWQRKNVLRLLPNWLFVALPSAWMGKVIGLHRKIFDRRGISETESQKRRLVYKRFLTLVESSLDVILD